MRILMNTHDRGDNVMKKILVIILSSLTLITGCVSSDPVEVSTVTITPTPTIASIRVIDTTGEANRYETTWVSPPEIIIPNYYAGATAEWPIRIHNGKDVLTSFVVKYSDGDKARGEFVYAPAGFSKWIIIEDESFVLKPKETKDILVTITIPYNVIIPSKWWFEVMVKEQGQGNVDIEYYPRWLVTMK
jgi:hypothetical protein